ncbi:MAG: hypothetical protein NUV54_00685 [Candidatus Taylorbacteria bacterium]|nr:hypothetical protein [Candidatus Taylorbacteria bacterium]
MPLAKILWYYIVWHYTRAWSDMRRVASNYLWFTSNFFSIDLLLRTLFSPWKRLSISGGRGKEDSLFGALIINTLMRFVGFGIRLFTIAVGAVALCIVFAIAVVSAVVWLLLPAIIVVLFFAGIGYIAGAILNL